MGKDMNVGKMEYSPDYQSESFKEQFLKEIKQSLTATKNSLCSERCHVFVDGNNSCYCGKMRQATCICPNCHQPHAHAELVDTPLAVKISK